MSISSIFLSGGYFLLFLACLVLILVLKIRDIVTRFKHLLFYILLTVMCLARGIFWAFNPSPVHLSSQGWVYNTLWSMPAIILVSTYSVMASYWADSYYKAHLSNRSKLEAAKKRRLGFLILINILMYLLEIVLLVFCRFNFKLFQFLQPYYLSVTYIVAVILYIIYGISLYISMRKEPISTPAKIRHMKQILWTTLIVTITFVIRFTTNFLWPIYINSWKGKWIFMAIFYFIVELLPIFLILLIITKLPYKKSTPMKPLLARSTYSAIQ